MFKQIMKLSIAWIVVISIAIEFTSCKSQEEDIVPAPTASTGNTEISGIIGSTVTISVIINAPAGLRSITILKNGAAFESKTLNSETAYTYTASYTIENNWATGSVVNFTIQAIDTKNQSSNLITIPIKVTAVPPKTTVTVSGTLEGNITWTADKIYKLSGFVRVGEDKTTTGTPTKAGVLTIQAGTVIIGEKATKGTLIIQRGSKIIAEGTADKPIVFTSELAPGERQAGDWGGLVICGRAKTNLIAAELEGAYGGFFGGTDDADNSGVLKYVRVEFAGIPINPNQEVNSFTFGAVGSGTIIDYCQASYGLDDSFEWFGGNVNVKHLIAYKGLDDDFDTDNGFSGNIQYGLGIRGTTLADQSGSNGFESDNDADGSLNTPFTSATFANMTIIGAKGEAATAISPQFQNGVQIRRSSKMKLYNSLITGYPNGIYIDSQKGQSKSYANVGDIVLENVVLAGVTGWGGNGWGSALGNVVQFPAAPRGFAVSDVEQNAALTAILFGTLKPSEWFVAKTGNKILENTSKTGISPTLWQTGKPTLTLASGTSETLVGPLLNTALPAFFDKTNYVGAFSATDWTTGWSEFNAQTAVYIK